MPTVCNGKKKVVLLNQYQTGGRTIDIDVDLIRPSRKRHVRLIDSDPEVREWKEQEHKNERKVIDNFPEIDNKVVEKLRDPFATRPLMKLSKQELDYVNLFEQPLEDEPTSIEISNIVKNILVPVPVDYEKSSKKPQEVIIFEPVVEQQNSKYFSNLPLTPDQITAGLQIKGRGILISRNDSDDTVKVYDPNAIGQATGLSIGSIVTLPSNYIKLAPVPRDLKKENNQFPTGQVIRIGAIAKVISPLSTSNTNSQLQAAQLKSKREQLIQQYLENKLYTNSTSEDRLKLSESIRQEIETINQQLKNISSATTESLIGKVGKVIDYTFIENRWHTIMRLLNNGTYKKTGNIVIPSIQVVPVQFSDYVNSDQKFRESVIKNRKILDKIRGTASSKKVGVAAVTDPEDLFSVGIFTPEKPLRDFTIFNMEGDEPEGEMDYGDHEDMLITLTADDQRNVIDQGNLKDEDQFTSEIDNDVVESSKDDADLFLDLIKNIDDIIEYDLPTETDNPADLALLNAEAEAGRNEVDEDNQANGLNFGVSFNDQLAVMYAEDPKYVEINRFLGNELTTIYNILQLELNILGSGGTDRKSILAKLNKDLQKYMDALLNDIEKERNDINDNFQKDTDSFLLGNGISPEWVSEVRDGLVGCKVKKEGKREIIVSSNIVQIRDGKKCETIPSVIMRQRHNMALNDATRKVIEETNSEIIKGMLLAGVLSNLNRGEFPQVPTPGFSKSLCGKVSFGTPEYMACRLSYSNYLGEYPIREIENFLLELMKLYKLPFNNDPSAGTTLCQRCEKNKSKETFCQQCIDEQIQFKLQVDKLRQGYRLINLESPTTIDKKSVNRNEQNIFKIFKSSMKSRQNKNLDKTQILSVDDLSKMNNTLKDSGKLPTTKESKRIEELMDVTFSVSSSSNLDSSDQEDFSKIKEKMRDLIAKMVKNERQLNLHLVASNAFLFAKVDPRLYEIKKIQSQRLQELRLITSEYLNSGRKQVQEIGELLEKYWKEYDNLEIPRRSESEDLKNLHKAQISENKAWMNINSFSLNKEIRSSSDSKVAKFVKSVSDIHNLRLEFADISAMAKALYSYVNYSGKAFWSPEDGRIHPPGKKKGRVERFDPVLIEEIKDIQVESVRVISSLRKVISDHILPEDDGGERFPTRIDRKYIKLSTDIENIDQTTRDGVANKDILITSQLEKTMEIKKSDLRKKYKELTEKVESSPSNADAKLNLTRVEKLLEIFDKYGTSSIGLVNTLETLHRLEDEARTKIGPISKTLDTKIKNEERARDDIMKDLDSFKVHDRKVDKRRKKVVIDNQQVISDLINRSRELVYNEMNEI